MLYSRERYEDEAFSSLSAEERRKYEEAYRQNGGDVQASLTKVLGSVWFNRDGTPRGHRHTGKNDDEK